MTLTGNVLIFLMRLDLNEINVWFSVKKPTSADRNSTSSTKKLIDNEKTKQETSIKKSEIDSSKPRNIPLVSSVRII